jgi:hypothetical protein
MAERHAYRAQRLETLHKIIESFIAGTDTSFQFDSSLTGYERMRIHEEAERVGLEHTSIGEGEDRCVVLYKEARSVASIEPENAPFDSGMLKPTTKSPQQKSKQKTRNPQPKRKSAKAAKPKHARRTPKSQPKLTEEELLEKMNPSRCYQCRTGLSHRLYGRVCQFCKMRYCTKCALPELHGCGTMASRNARSKFQATPKARPNPNREAVTKKLHDQLNAKQTARKKKGRGKGKAKGNRRR